MADVLERNSDGVMERELLWTWFVAFGFLLSVMDLVQTLETHRLTVTSVAAGDDAHRPARTHRKAQYSSSLESCIWSIGDLCLRHEVKRIVHVAILCREHTTSQFHHNLNLPTGFTPGTCYMITSAIR